MSTRTNTRQSPQPRVESTPPKSSSDGDESPDVRRVTVTRKPADSLDTVILRVDGSYHHHKDLAAAGIVIESNDGKTYCECWMTVESPNTSTQTEAKAMLEGLKIAQSYDPSFVMAYSDCKPVVRKIQAASDDGTCGRPIYEEINSVTDDTTIDHLRFSHIPRARNERADYLASRGLREQKRDGPMAAD